MSAETGTGPESAAPASAAADARPAVPEAFNEQSAPVVVAPVTVEPAAVAGDSDGDSEAAQESAALPSLPDVPVLRRDTPVPENRAGERTQRLATVLIDAGLSIAIAESLTGGALAAELVRVPGISKSFRGGVVSYTNDVKARLLGVERELLLTRGAVNAEVAIAMARGVRDACALDEQPADIGISTTGVAGPDPADGEQPGTVFVGMSTLWGDRAFRLDFGSLVRDDDPVGSRQRIRYATIEAAMFDLLEYLQEQASN